MRPAKLPQAEWHRSLASHGPSLQQGDRGCGIIKHGLTCNRWARQDAALRGVLHSRAQRRGVQARSPDRAGGRRIGHVSASSSQRCRELQ